MKEIYIYTLYAFLCMHHCYHKTDLDYEAIYYHVVIFCIGHYAIFFLHLFFHWYG